MLFDFSIKMLMLDQMIEGLRSLRMLECIRKNAELLEPVFAKATIFSANTEIFLKTMLGDFSESGSNSKEIEINIYKYLNLYKYYYINIK